jgi:hypothetical protein
MYDLQTLDLVNQRCLLAERERKYTQPWVPRSYEEVDQAFVTGLPLPLLSADKPLSPNWQRSSLPPWVTNVDNPEAVELLRERIIQASLPSGGKIGFVADFEIRSQRRPSVAVLMVRRV